MARRRTVGHAGFLVTLAISALAPSRSPAADPVASPDRGARRDDVPAWLFAFDPPPGAAAPATDPARWRRVPGGTVTFRDAQLHDLYFAPDWRPRSHAPMPEIVARGRAPGVYACGYCHSPSGQGRPENASLAGLPAAYIVQQVADFRSGARRSAWPGRYLPSALMIDVAMHATEDEVAAAAAYFAQQTLERRAIVAERAHVPRMTVVGWVYVAQPRAGEEPLGERLLETAPDPVRHESRDDAMRYVAYVPPGSIARGRAIAQSGGGATVACVSCHGAGLRGVGLVPPLAGRSPTYLLRQLVAFQAGTRAGPTGQPMQPVVAGLAMGQMIDVAAYAASLRP
jgi:cytochrome c553